MSFSLIGFQRLCRISKGDWAGVKAINVSEYTAVMMIFTRASLVANSNGNRIAEFGHRGSEGY